MEKERLAKLVAQEDDGYAEAYPASFEGVGFAALDEEEDEEAGLRNIDTRQNLKRHEFESDEAWAAYESQKEAIPKAAFQFGIKKEDGRQKKAFTEQKLKKQLRAVEDMIEEKQGKKIGGFEDVEEPKGRKQRDWPSERGGGKPRAPVVDVNSYENRSPPPPARVFWVLPLSISLFLPGSLRSGRSVMAPAVTTRALQRNPAWNFPTSSTS